MASESNRDEPSKHVAIFPPAINQSCKLENLPQMPTKTNGPSGVVEARADGPVGIEDEEAERWDGMS
jgi:hypothetical protein